MQASRTADHLMATRRRDVLPGKEKATSPQTATAKLKGAVNKITKTNVSTALKQQTKPAPKIATANASKPQVRKPASSATVNKPAQARTRPLVTKTVASPKPVQKTRVASVAAAPSRSSSFPSRTVASPKPVPGKSLKPVIKDEGKRRLSPPASNARRSSIGLKKKESGTSTSAKKEAQITSITVDKVEDLSMYCVPEPEIQLNDIEYSYLTEAEEKTIQSLSDIAKNSINALVTEIDQEPLYFAKVGDEIDHADSKVVIAESYPVSNDVIEETANKLREQRRNRVRALAGAFETIISLQEK